MDRFRLMPNYRYYNIEGVSPLTLEKSAGRPLRDYKIYGNSMQDGTPTTDSPVEIQSVGDKSKNLFDIADFAVKSNYSNAATFDKVSVNGNSITISNASSVSIRLKNTKLYQYLKPNTKYTVNYKRKVVEGTESNTTGYICLLPNVGSGYNFCYKTVPITRTTPSDLSSYTLLTIYGGANCTVTFSDIIIKEDDGNTKYEPYGYKIPITVDEETYNIYLDEPIQKMGSYADYIDFINRKVIKKNKKATVYSANWKEYKVISDNVRAYIASNMFPDCNKTNAYNTSNKCNKFKYLIGSSVGTATENDGEWLALRNGTVYVAIKTEHLSEVTLEAATEYINGLNAEIVYQLAEPIEEDITLPTIKTHKGTNIITVGTTVPASNIAVQYYK